MTRILITSVRGKTGAPLADLLVERDVEVLGGSTNPSSIEQPRVRPTAFSWDDPSGWPLATDGVDALYLVRPDRQDAPALVAGLLEVTAPSTHVVLLSELDADSFPPTRWALQVEQAVRASGRTWTVLRPGWFMQVLTDERFLRDDIAAGRLPFPAAGARLAWIDTRDIAAVAEQALLDHRLRGTVHELSGPEALSLPATAALLSEALGRLIEHVEPSIEDAVAGTEGFERWEFVTTYERVQAGIFATVTNGVEHVTGRPARTLRAFLTDHAADAVPSSVG